MAETVGGGAEAAAETDDGSAGEGAETVVGLEVEKTAAAETMEVVAETVEVVAETLEEVADKTGETVEKKVVDRVGEVED